MEEIVEQDNFYNEMCCLRLKKGWDKLNGGYYLQEQRRFTPLGLLSYWAGVDAAIKFWSKTLQEVLIRKQKKMMTENSVKPKSFSNIKMQLTVTKVEHSPGTLKKKRSHSFNKYVWRRPTYKDRRHSYDTETYGNRKHHHRRLPPPPPKRH